MCKQPAIRKASPHTCYFFWKGSVSEHSIRIAKKAIEKKFWDPFLRGALGELRASISVSTPVVKKDSHLEEL